MITNWFDRLHGLRDSVEHTMAVNSANAFSIITSQEGWMWCVRSGEGLLVGGYIERKLVTRNPSESLHQDEVRAFLAESTMVIGETI